MTKSRPYYEIFSLCSLYKIDTLIDGRYQVATKTKKKTRKCRNIQMTLALANLRRFVSRRLSFFYCLRRHSNPPEASIVLKNICIWFAFSPRTKRKIRRDSANAPWNWKFVFYQQQNGAGYSSGESRGSVFVFCLIWWNSRIVFWSAMALAIHIYILVKDIEKFWLLWFLINYFFKYACVVYILPEKCVCVGV